MSAKYESIMEFIKTEIKTGNLKPEEKIPSIRQLSNKFKCSNTTIITAYSRLEKENIIYSKPQSGYYVTKKLTYSSCCCDKNDGSINFDSGSPSKSVLPYMDYKACVNEAINIYGNDLFSYTHPSGFIPLRQTLEKIFRKDGFNVNYKNIYITSGAQQALSILCNMPFPNNNDVILVEQPTYNLMLGLLEITNSKVMSIERSFNGIDFNKLEEIFKTKNIKFFYTIPRFHNPLGTSYSSEEKKHLIELAEKYDVYIIEDDYLTDLETNINAKSLYALDCNSRVVYIRSFSKTYLPSIRIASVVLPEILLKTFEKFKVFYDLNSCLTSQGALDISLNNGMFNNHIETIRKIYNDKMNVLKDTLNRLDTDNLNFHIAKTGFFSFIKLPQHVKASQLINNLRYKNICVRNGDRSYLPQYKTDNSIRISLCRVSQEEIKLTLPEIINEINNLTAINHSDSIDLL